MRKEKIKEKRVDRERGLRKMKEIISYYKKKHRKLKQIIYGLRKKNKILKQRIVELEGSLVPPKDEKEDRKSTRLNSSHSGESRMPSSA